jgi:hypothetical protein
MGKNLEGSDEGLIVVLSRYLSDEAQGNHETFRIESVMAEIQTEHLMNTNLERYRYANPPESTVNMVKISRGPM